MKESRIFKFSNGEIQVSWSVSLNGGNFEEVKCFRFLEVEMVVNATISI